MCYNFNIYKMNFLKIKEPWTLNTPLWLTLFTIFLIWYLQYHWKRRYLYIHSRNIPGPKGWPLIGNILDFTGGSDEIYNTITKHFARYPSLTKVWYGSTLIYGVSKPEYLELVLTNPNALSKMYLYKYAEPLVGYGLFTAPVPIWKRHRKIIMKAFNQKVLDSFVEIFARQTTIMGKHLETMVGDKEFDVFHVVSRCTLDIICETAMGIRVDAQSGNSVFGQWVDRLLEIMFLRMFVIWYHFDFFFKWTRLHNDNSHLTEKFNAFTSKIINEKIAKFGTEESPKQKAFLDLLIELAVGDNKLTEEEIRDEVNTFMIAGSDTTAGTVSFVFMMLGMYPDIQNKVYREVTEILGSEEVEPKDLPHFKYTERVIKETLRLFPIGPYIVRDIKDDISLKDGFVLAKGSSAILGIMTVHRNGDIWPNPLKFDPDRFLPEEVSKRHPFAYLPFSGGLRNCIGPKYAIMAMVTMVATTIRKFEFSTSYQKVEDIKLKTNLVLRPQNGFAVTVKLRT